MSHRDLLVTDKDGNVTLNRHTTPYEERSPLPVQGERYRKRPVEVRAVYYGGPDDIGLIENFVGPHNIGPGTDGLIAIWVEPSDQWVNLHPGEWVIKGVEGEFYPCARSVFEATYEKVSTRPARGIGQ